MLKQIELNLNFNEAIHGSQRVIYYDREVECQSCQGTRALFTKQCTKCKGCGVLPDDFICPCCDNGHIIEEECTQCGGSGKEEANKELIINIPKGISNDTILKFDKLGNFTKFGYTDLFIKFNVAEDKYFERKKDDIYTVAYVPLSKALLGGKIKVLGLYSPVEVNIPPESVDNSVIKLKGLGVNKKGDHYVRLKIVLPKILNKEQIQIFEQLAKYEV